jgi:nitrogen fixation/metabolism regulation signal transduction histidine kinase
MPVMKTQLGRELQYALDQQWANLHEQHELRSKKDTYLKNIVQHAGVGILTVKPDGKVDIINAEAKHLLRIAHLENIRDLQESIPGFVAQINNLKTGAKALVYLPDGNGMLPVSMYVIELAWEGEVIKLLSLQNIQSELDEKEMEAWQNLIRILTHEIMNSVTPISSLAATIEDEISKTYEDDKAFTEEEIEDIKLGIKTIRRRSEGLIRFVSDFRNLTRVPNPQPEPTSIKVLFEEVILLMQPEIKKCGAEVSVDVIPETLEISLDKELIAQVLINLVKNACEAMCNLEEGKPRRLNLGAQAKDGGNGEISVEDSGTGIEEEALQRIFIPFFTTKKTGSGIGLSLSKQIMRKHEGNLLVSSQLNKGAKFTLRF